MFVLAASALASCSRDSVHEARPMTCAIDMGSNSFRRIVGSFHGGRYIETRIESKTMGVGDDVVRHGRISDAKMAEIADTLASFHGACQLDGTFKTVAVGTAAFRDAPNGARVVEIASRLGVSMEIASEQRESELAYLVGSLGMPDLAVIDNGSRSIELVARDAGAAQYAVFNLGYRIAWDEFFATAPAPAPAIAALRARLQKEAARAPFMKDRKKLVGVEYQEMADVLFEPGPVEGRVFTVASLKERLERIAAQPGEFAALKEQKDVDRALPRLVGAVTFAEAFGYAQIELTARQLGAGLIVEAGLHAAAPR
jgi:exopolyphosphatase/pppGpp-phosphohydrolase